MFRERRAGGAAQHTVIDLGPRYPDTTPDDDGDEPVGLVGGRLPARLRYRWICAVLAALVLATVAGAAAPAPMPRLRHVATLDLAAMGYRGMPEYEIEGNLLLVLGPLPSLPSLTTYQLRDGRAAWRPDRHLVPVARAGDLLVLETPPCLNEPDQVVGVDMATGRIRWRQPGFLRMSGSGFGLIGAAPGYWECTGPGSVIVEPLGPAAPVTTVTATVVRLATGVPAWSVAMADDVIPALGTDATGRAVLLAMDAGGRWIRRDLATGARLDPPGQPRVWDAGTQRPGPTTITMPAGAVVAATLVGVGQEMSGYDPTTLRRLWYRPAGGQGDSLPFRQIRCGRPLCVGTFTGSMRLDPATGAVRWYTSAATTLEQLGPNWLLGTPPYLADDHAVVLDVATGRVAVALAPWTLAGADVPISGPSPVAVLYRYDNGRTWFAMVDPGQGYLAPRVIGYLAGDKEDCVTGGKYVACRDEDGSLDLWRLPR